MKARLKYYFSRLMVLLVALNTLDASVDLDYLTNSIGWYDSEKYDDIDSISEFVIEKIFRNDHLFPESNNDDTHQTKSRISQGSLIVLCVSCIKDWNVKPAFRLLNNIRPSSGNTRLLFEDHSYADYNPPDFSHPRG